MCVCIDNYYIFIFYVNCRQIRFLVAVAVTVGAAYVFGYLRSCEILTRKNVCECVKCIPLSFSRYCYDRQ